MILTSKPLLHVLVMAVIVLSLNQLSTQTGFLNENHSKPQQLSTYALTLFQYKTRVDGIDVRVGRYTLYLLIYVVTKSETRFVSNNPTFTEAIKNCRLVMGKSACMYMYIQTSGITQTIRPVVH